mmetsp:Transcript_23943/g.44447  ORF Transcript_23943/g.44447 Transcript_23943/m.44447 type:complete len:374 (+) Transcript_23943:46-1167(+)
MERRASDYGNRREQDAGLTTFSQPPALSSLEEDIENERLLDSTAMKTSRLGAQARTLTPSAKPQRKYSFPVMFLLFTVFMTSGPFLIMSNKYVLKDLGFAFPLTLTLITLIFCSFVCWVFVWTTGYELKHTESMTRSFYLKKICPIGALSAGTIVLGMASYLFLTVAFVQMLKAFTPVMTLGGLVLFRLEKPSQKVVLCVLLICLGTAIAGFGELNFSLVGISCMCLAQMFEALKLIFTQQVLQNLKFGVVESLYYITPSSAGFVFLAAALLEFPRMTHANVQEIYDNLHVFSLSCTFAVLTNVINTFVIQFSNALVLKLLATARNALLVIFNAVVMAEHVTPLQFFGYTVSLVGFSFYNYVKYQESAALRKI